MKVLIITNLFPTKRNLSSGTFVADQVKSLEHYIKLSVVHKVQNSQIGYCTFGVKAAFASLKRDYDLVHAHYGFHSALVPVLCRCQPLIVTFHGSDALIEPTRSRLYRSLQHWVASYASHIIAVSEEIRLHLIGNLGAKPENVTVLPCGVDINMFRPLAKQKVRSQLGIGTNVRMALFIGRLTEAKGANLIQEAARRLEDVEFYLIGKGPNRWNAPNCRFIGVVDHSEVSEWINAADLLLLPSQSEGTPAVVLEALACETPVICSNVGNCANIVEEGATGLLIPPKNAEALINAMKVALHQMTFNMNLGRNMVVDEYSLEQTSRRLYQLYSQVLGEFKGNTSTV